MTKAERQAMAAKVGQREFHVGLDKLTWTLTAKNAKRGTLEWTATTKNGSTAMLRYTSVYGEFKSPLLR